MKNEKIFYCVARSFPVYYKVDPRSGFIESVKNWHEYPKALERFAYSAVLARELKTYKRIDRAAYEEVREYVSGILSKRAGLKGGKDTSKG